MPYEETNPLRRNLVVLSTAIIIFYVGGCEIPSSGEITLPLINLTFTNARHLAWLVWVALLWFLARYWIETKNESYGSFRKVIQGGGLEGLVKFLYSNIFAQYAQVKKGSFHYHYSTNGDNIFAVKYEVTENSGATHQSRTLKLQGLRKLIIQGVLVFKRVLLHRVFSTDYFPYVVCLVAILFGLNSLIAKSFYIEEITYFKVLEFISLDGQNLMPDFYIDNTIVGLDCEEVPENSEADKI